MLAYLSNHVGVPMFCKGASGMKVMTQIEQPRLDGFIFINLSQVSTVAYQADATDR